MAGIQDCLRHERHMYFIKDADGAPIKTQHFKFKIIASICMGHSAYEVLYQMNKSMEASVNNEDTFMITAAVLVLYLSIVLSVLTTFQIIGGQYF